ncbi:hypothetical protein E4P82_15565 [Candidatus Competibacter phosphatis]|uniref:VCBS repeat-containing protein n=1 Tax=Candidatus Competibacter phosphatis TaxID=221280 RepID=A0ABX1TM52_9GAMM|nr:hypothetical protein [Candidatus Competibacter phosphatis]NMQ20485.1 hypothetical protein [Candidatus Competibacter phosphatis]
MSKFFFIDVWTGHRLFPRRESGGARNRWTGDKGDRWLEFSQRARHPDFLCSEKKTSIIMYSPTPVKLCMSPRSWKKLEDDLCLSDKKKHWYLLPDDGAVSLNRASSLVIVIESNVKTKLRAVATKPPDLDQALLSNYVGDIARAEKLTNTAHDIRNAGYQNHTQRMVVILTSKNRDQAEAIDRVVVSVADIDGDNIREKYRYRKSRGDSGDLIANFTAMADIDQDGLADVLLIDQGDFHGKILLIEKKQPVA